jgi:hypothetical protein
MDILSAPGNSVLQEGIFPAISDVFKYESQVVFDTIAGYWYCVEVKKGDFPSGTLCGTFCRLTSRGSLEC